MDDKERLNTILIVVFCECRESLILNFSFTRNTHLLTKTDLRIAVHFTTEIKQNL